MSNLAPNPALYAGLPTGWTVQNALSGNNGGGDQSLVNGGSAPTQLTQSFNAAANGFLFENGDIATAFQTAGSLTAITTGVGYLSKFYWGGGTLTNLYLDVITAGATLSHGWLAVFDNTGVQWGITADQGGTAFGSTGVKQFALASAVVLSTGWYRAYVLAVGTTGPKLAPAFPAISATANADLAAGNFRFSTLGSSLSAVPASLTLSGEASDVTIEYWVAGS
jgi:hypothetical protein